MTLNVFHAGFPGTQIMCGLLYLILLPPSSHTMPPNCLVCFVWWVFSVKSVVQVNLLFTYPQDCIRRPSVRLKYLGNGYMFRGECFH